MRVAHVNTLTYGGAAVVAKRIHHALLELKADSRLITKYGVKNDLPQHFFLQNGKLRTFLRKRLFHPSVYPLVKFAQSLRPHPNLAGRPEGFEIFSPLHSQPLPDKFGALRDADIIHLHWVNDFLDYSTFFKTYADRKFVWTLHDMNPVTGGCHHSDGCMKFESKCTQCPQLKGTGDANYAFKIQQEKIEGLRSLKDDQLVIVSPSSWLLELSRKSRITGRFRHMLIPNPSFKNVQFEATRASVRDKLILPPSKKIVLFASDNLHNPRKGINLLFEIIQSIPRRDEIVLVGIGHKSKPLGSVESIYTGSLSDPRVLAEYFYCADIFVTPTLAENSPLVVIESLTCGTPVVASEVGGLPDLVRENNGILFPVGQRAALGQAIEQALFERTFDRQQIMEDARSHHDPIRIAEAYQHTYNDLLSH